MAKVAKKKSADRQRLWRFVLATLGFLLLVLVAYWPALSGQFIWDDDENIVNSVALRSFKGLLRIWFEPGATQQYYPLTHTSFWLDYHLWGLHPAMYHLENLLLHAASAVLLWRVLRRLGVRGAWLAAAIFALHPVCVESVAWITERKNALSGVFYLASALAAIEFWLPKKTEQAPASGRTRSTKSGKPSAAKANTPGAQFGESQYYWLALVFYACALCSKSATIALPAVILLIAWWKRGSLVKRDAVLMLPFLACGLAMAAITISIENHLRLNVGGPNDWQFSPIQRLLIGSRAVWFYLGKIIWPHPLMFLYPRWNIQPSNVLAYAPLAAAIAMFAALWSKRKTWGRPALVAFGSFVAILLPVLGAFNVFFYRYSFVCDHFQYLAAIGPIALAGAVISIALNIFSKGHPLLKPAVCGILLLTLGTLTWRQTGVFENLETLWRDTLVHNPNAWMAHDNLGVLYSQKGRFEEADHEYQTAINLRPNDHVAYYDLGLECAMRGELDKAIQYYNESLNISPSYALAHYQMANVLERQGKLDDAIREYTVALKTYPNFTIGHFNLADALAKKGDWDDGIAEYKKALALDPEFELAAVTLGNALARKGNLDDAIEQYTKAIEIQPADAHAHASLGRALAAKGNANEAIVHYQKALEIDPKSVEAMANLANAMVGQQRFDEAVALYRSALRLNPTSAVLHYNLAAALSRLGNTVEAQAELNQAKQLQEEQAMGK
ncbi:MAG TPA: tetratricopeptide repeat protein [Verrucomicrobiae bacterium]|nr:tetratricopeptide repeat protein [Verrucomicrobiae bacterium]